MPFALKLAVRSLRARRGGLARVTAWLALVGVAAGVGGMVFADALARGFAGEMRARLLGNYAHVSVYAPDGAAIQDWKEVSDLIAATEGVTSVIPLNFADAAVVSDGGTGYAAIKSDPRDPAPDGTVRIGARLAETLKVKAGDEIEVVTMATRKGVKARVDGTFTTGVYDYDASWIACSPATFGMLVEREAPKPNMLAVSVGDVFTADVTASRIRSILGQGVRVVDWQEANRPFFAALATERRAASAVIALMILFAALNITTTLYARVAERRLDIAVLKTCGATPGQIVSSFLLEGMMIGSLGVVSGVVLGILACLASNRFGLLRLPPEVYSLEQIPLTTSGASVGLIAIGALALCLLATIVPATSASRISAGENLRRK